MLNDRVSRLALALSLLAHAALVAPVWGILGTAERASRAAPPTPAPDPMAFTFVDPRPVPETVPDEPTPLVSTRDGRAAQPESPRDLPEGAPFRAGETPVPTTPRSAAARDPATAEAAGDARLAIPRNAIGPGSALSRPSVDPSDGARLPSPEVDQRLSRARAGSDFSLNTTAWEYGPYLSRLKREIEEQIFPPPAFYYGTAAWATRVRFRIAPDGSMTSLTLLDHRGVPNLQYVATSAIEGAADFEPLPPGFPEAYLEITGAFYFNTVIPGDR
ncbi:MAG TPA: hypothetical protein VM737_09370 [Gemmatimonadota bacterium]|nr:hypothetical protein [Gemmatimonadota bacterium]